MPAPRKYPSELRDRAQRPVQEARGQEPGLTLNAAVLRIGPRVGVNPDTLRGWCKQAAIDTGHQPGTTTEDAGWITALERENRELKRANETSHASGMSSGLGLWAGKGEGLVVRRSCGQAVVQAAEETVEQVSLRGGVLVASGAASVVVPAGPG